MSSQDGKPLPGGYPDQDRLGTVLEGGGIIVAYLLGWVVATGLSAGDVPLLSPPAAVALAGLLLFGIKYWPAVWASATFVALMGGVTPWVGIGIGTAHTLATVLGVGLLRRGAGFSVRMEGLRDVAALAVLGAGASQALAAVVSALVLVTAGLIPTTAFGDRILTQWLADVTGVLAVTPLLLALVDNPKREGWPVTWPIEAGLGLFVSIILSIALFGGRIPSNLAGAALLLPFPLLLWGALRFGLHGVATLTLIVSGVATWRTDWGAGPFGPAALRGEHLPLWIYVISLALAGLVTWALIGESRRSLMRFQAVFESSSDGIMLLRDGRIVHCNAAAVRLFGTRAADRLMSATLEELSPSRQPDQVPSDVGIRAHLEEAERNGGDRFDWVHRRVDGTTFPAEIVLSPVLFDGRAALLAVVRDMTQHRAHEESLKLAWERAAAADRGKTEYLAKWSHEIRSALNANLGFSSLLARDPSLPAKHRDHVEKILRSGTHVLELVDDVLEMWRVEAGRMGFRATAFDLKALLRELEDTFRVRAAEKGLALAFQVAPEVPQFVRTDYGNLRQVLINLLGNAVKFTERGSVTFSVRVAHEEMKPGEVRFFFDVSDTGPGIRAEDLERVFMPAPEDEREGTRGTGAPLGLPGSRAFARLLDGDLTVRSREGEGSRFRLEIAARTAWEDEVLGAPERRVVGLAPGQKPRRILVVDDREENRTLLTALLTRVGFDVREAVDGMSAIEAFSTWSPDLLFMNREMPRMDGSEATRRIRVTKRGRSTPIIMVTAGGLGEEASDILAAGADGLVRIPFREAELLAEVEQHLGVRFTYEEPGKPSGI